MAERAVQRRRPWVVAGILAAAAIAAGGALLLRLRDSEGVVLVDLGSYTEAVAGTWQRVNPLFATTNDVDQDLSALVYSGLVKLGPDQAPQPDLAALPEISSDGRTYTFHLRKDARWQDGTPVTADDVTFTVGRLADPDFKGDPALAESWSGVQVEAPDESTVRFTLKQASAPFLARNATLGILPRHLLGTLNAAALYDAPFNSTPVGSGPYKIQSLNAREAVLAANESYYGGQPGVGTIRLRFYPDYPSAIRALASGEAQGLFARESLSEAQFTELHKLKGMKIDTYQRAAYLVLDLNNDQAAFFQDERVRRAIGLALDRQGIVDRVFAGLATASASAVSPGNWAYAKEYDAPAPDLEQARRLLAEAGWLPHPTTGILTREGGEFRFTLRTDNDPIRVAVAGEIARSLEPLGIRATVASTTFSALRRDFLQERKYDAAVAGWDQGNDPDPYFGWHSSQMGTAGLNIANFGDVVVDELIAKARTTNDVAVRKDQYRQFQEKWQDLAPGVVIAYPRYVYVHAESLQGPKPALLAVPAQRFMDVNRWRN
ncbi:MAG: hypothetical protein IT304_03230 [Dehalococcoidia bacterium]|nr:hypothetical protein [Dehalococcoidia bacterium]